MSFVRRLLFVPMCAFLRMAEELGEPREIKIFLYSTGRCGSTLLTGMMERTERCVSLSEPEIFKDITALYLKYGMTDKVKTITRACIAWQSRPIRELEHRATLLKLSGQSTFFFMHHLVDLYPSSKHIFMYRGVENVSKSIFRMFRHRTHRDFAYALGIYKEPIITVDSWFSDYTVKNFNSIVRNGHTISDFQMKAVDDIDHGVCLWALACREYIKLRQSGFPTAAIRYEDLVGNPRFSMQQILEYCGLPASLTEKALRGLEVDSQRNSPISQSILRRHKDPEMTVGAVERGNELMKRFGLPLINSDGILDGTLTLENNKI